MTILKYLAGRIALICLGLLVPLFMLEIGVRQLDFAPPPDPNPAIWAPHPLFGWWHIPHSGGTFHSNYNEFAAEVKINARGLRDREIGYENEKNALRILSLADSFGEALQVNLDKTYHKQLESRLSDTLAHPVEVINAGVGGWGTDQEAIFYLAEGFRYQPDIVLLSFFIRNDVVNNDQTLELTRNGGSQQKQFFSLDENGGLIAPELEQTEPVLAEDAPAQSNPDQRSPEAGPPLLSTADLLWEWSALYRFLVPHLRDNPAIVQQVGKSGILGGEGVVRAEHPTTPIPFFIYQTPPDAQFEQAWQLTAAILNQLKAQVEQRGSKLIVVIISAPEQLNEADLTDFDGLSEFDLDYPNERLGHILSQADIPHLDLLPIFRQAQTNDSEPLHFRYDQHWTPAGHKLAADAIYDFLLYQELISVREAHRESYTSTTSN